MTGTAFAINATSCFYRVNCLLHCVRWSIRGGQTVRREDLTVSSAKFVPHSRQFIFKFPRGVYTKTNLASKWVSKKNRRKMNYKHQIKHSDWLIIWMSSIFVYLKQKDTTIWVFFGGREHYLCRKSQPKISQQPTPKNINWNLKVFRFLWGW